MASLFGGLKSSAFLIFTLPLFNIVCGVVLLFGIGILALP
jgi:hypothetical protein